jgi:hypothetical protein
MNQLNAEQRGAGTGRVWTEHDDELPEIMMELFGVDRETPRQENSSCRRGQERRATPVLLD